MLAMAYLEAYQATHKPEYATTAREIFTYVLRDLRAPNGAFYSASDSDERGVRDEKILTDWNGLMIAALASGAAVLDDDDVRDRRETRCRRRPRGRAPAASRGQRRLSRRLRLLIWGLLNLYEATFEARTSTAPSHSSASR